MADTKKALQFVQAARHALRWLYLGDAATDEEAVAETVVPSFLRELAEYLHAAESELTEEYIPWYARVAEVTADGPILIEQIR